MEKVKPNLTPDDISLIWYLIDDVREDFCDNPKLLKMDPVTEENFRKAFCEEVLSRYTERNHGVAARDVVVIKGTGTKYDGASAEVTHIGDGCSIQVKGGLIDTSNLKNIEAFDLALKKGQYDFSAQLTLGLKKIRKKAESKPITKNPDVF